MKTEETLWDIVKDGVREYIEKYVLTAEEMILFCRLEKNEYKVDPLESRIVFHQLLNWSRKYSPEVSNRLEAYMRVVLDCK